MGMFDDASFDDSVKQANRMIDKAATVFGVLIFLFFGECFHFNMRFL